MPDSKISKLPAVSKVLGGRLTEWRKFNKFAMQGKHMSIKKIIHISADSANFTSPSETLTGAPVRFFRGDVVEFRVALFSAGALAFTDDIQSLVLEVLDAGALNAPQPRDVKVVMKKTLERSALILNPAAEACRSADAWHAAFVFGAFESAVAEGEKVLKIYAQDEEGGRLTFCSGWIFTEADYTQNGTPEIVENVEYVTKTYAETAYLKRTKNLSDLQSKPDALENIDGISSADFLSEVDDLRRAAARAIRGAELAVGRLEIQHNFRSLYAEFSIFCVCDFSSFTNAPIWYDGDATGFCGFLNSSALSLCGAQITVTGGFARGDRLAITNGAGVCKIFRNKIKVFEGAALPPLRLSALFGLSGAYAAVGACPKFYAANFDASAAGAKYTPEMFESHEAVPNALRYGGPQFVSDKSKFGLGRVAAYAPAYYALSYDGANLKLTCTAVLSAPLTVQFYFNDVLPEGLTARFSCGQTFTNRDTVKNAVFFTMLYADGTTSGGYGTNGGYAGGFIDITLPKNTSGIRIAGSLTAGEFFQIGDYITFGEVCVEVRGFSYIFEGAADGVQWLNGSKTSLRAHGLFAGTAYGATEKRAADNIQIMSWDGTADAKYFLSDSALVTPMNCRISIYAKPSAALSVDVGSELASTAYAASKALAAGVWTEVLPWYSKQSAAQKMKVQPKAAFAGTVEIIVKTERL